MVLHSVAMAKKRKKEEKDRTYGDTVLSLLFRANLQRAREKMDLTQAALAARSGFSVSYLSMLERGTRDPTLLTVEHVSRALGFEHPRDMFRGKAA